MSKKLLASVVTAGGAVLLALGLLADVLGLGAHPGFGWAQIGLIALGLVALAASVPLYRRALDAGRAPRQPHR